MLFIKNCQLYLIFNLFSVFFLSHSGHLNTLSWGGFRITTKYQLRRSSSPSGSSLLATRCHSGCLEKMNSPCKENKLFFFSLFFHNKTVSEYSRVDEFILDSLQNQMNNFTDASKFHLSWSGLLDGANIVGLKKTVWGKHTECEVSLFISFWRSNTRPRHFEILYWIFLFVTQNSVRFFVVHLVL